MGKSEGKFMERSSTEKISPLRKRGGARREAGRENKRERGKQK